MAGKELCNLLPVVPVCLKVIDVPELNLAPSAGLMQRLDDSDREHEELWRKNVAFASLVTTVKAYDNNKITCEIVDEEPGSTRAPSTLNLNPCGAVCIWVCGYEIVTRHVCVGLVARDAPKQQLTERKELRTFRFELCVQSRHMCLCNLTFELTRPVKCSQLRVKISGRAIGGAEQVRVE